MNGGWNRLTGTRETHICILLRSGRKIRGISAEDLHIRDPRARENSSVNDRISANVYGSTGKDTVESGTDRLSGREAFLRVDFINHHGRKAWSNLICL